MDMDTVDPLETAKTVQKNRVGHCFRTAPDGGCVVAAGYRMDSARVDVDNMARLRDRMLETGAVSVTIRDQANQFHDVTVAELSTIVGELIDFGLGLYTRKWQRELEIDAATTVAAVEEVVW
jgi:hypothetical protein